MVRHKSRNKIKHSRDERARRQVTSNVMYLSLLVSLGNDSVYSQKYSFVNQCLFGEVASANCKSQISQDLAKMFSEQHYSNVNAPATICARFLCIFRANAGAQSLDSKK